MDQSKVTRWIETSFERDLVHSDTDEVLPLHSQHRRKVTFSVRVSVHHANLDIEFLTLRKFCRDLWAGDTHHVGNTSLEQIGENLLQALTHLACARRSASMGSEVPKDSRCCPWPLIEYCT